MYTCSALVIKPKRKYTLRKVNAAKLAITLTPLQIDVLVGTMLGDAHIERIKPTHNSRIRFDPSFPAHASYLMMLYGIFYNLTTKGPSVSIRSPDRRTGNIYSSLAFKTQTLPCLNYWHSLFYPNGVKVVPTHIDK